MYTFLASPSFLNAPLILTLHWVTFNLACSLKKPGRICSQCWSTVISLMWSLKSHPIAQINWYILQIYIFCQVVPLSLFIRMTHYWHTQTPLPTNSHHPASRAKLVCQLEWAEPWLWDPDFRQHWVPTCKLPRGDRTMPGGSEAYCGSSLSMFIRVFNVAWVWFILKVSHLLTGSGSIEHNASLTMTNITRATLVFWRCFVFKLFRHGRQDH